MILRESLAASALVLAFICVVDAVRTTNAVRHFHRRRSIEHDPRYLDFKFIVEPNSVTVGDGGSALFHCTYRIGSLQLDNADAKSLEELSSAEAHVEWRKDGTSVDHLRSFGKIRTLANGSLLIENSNPSDEGVYQCAVHVRSAPLVAATPWIFLSRRVTLQTPHVERFDSQPIDQHVFAGSRTAFRCLINSKPAASIEWYKGNNRLRADGSVGILPVSQTLEIGNVSRADADDYKCVVRNGAKTRISQIGTLYVKEDVNEIAGTLSVVLEPRSQVRQAGDAFILECLVNGFPPPATVWSRDGAPIAVDTRRRFVGAANSSLVVERAQLADAGVYVCRAENGEDSVELTATVSIRTPPTIVVGPIDQFTQETLDAEFECMADGVPKPRLTWYKNGEVIIPSEYFVIASNRLKVFGLVRDDQGIYQCFAENDIGSAQASAQLLVDAADILSRYYALFGKESNATVSLFSARLRELLSLSAANGNGSDSSHMALTAAAGDSHIGESSARQPAPLQPLALRATEVGSRTIELSWDPPLNSGTVSLYHIFYREEDSTREKLANSSKNSAKLAGLRPGVVHFIRVAGENEQGLGKTSDTVRVLTKREDAVPGRVRNFRAEVLGSETIQVDWDPPSTDAGAPAVRYRLFYERANATEDEHETQVLMIKTSYTLHGMEKYTVYRIRIEAEGANGVGPSSDRLTVQTFADVPSAPPKAVQLEALSPRSVRVRWTAPDPDQRNGPIAGYKIRYKTRRKGSKGNAVVVDGDPGTFLVDGLEAGTQYTFRLAAMTLNGTGVFSDWMGVDTPMEDREETQIAGAPSELRVHAGHDFVRVSWLPPRDDSVMIRGYLIGWGINIPDVEKASVDANVRHYTIKGLKPSREYVISLRAFNNVGNGFPIYETVQTTAYSFVRPSPFQTDDDEDGVGSSSSRGRSLTPIGVIAEPLSASSIRLSWSDPNDGFNQYYTVRYNSGDENSGHARQFNTSETEVVMDGLKPNTQYEFAVRLADAMDDGAWSMSAVNRTLAAPPSSAPRELSIFAAPAGSNDDEGAESVTLSWQPPKYANGDVEEYIVLYSDKLDLSDKDWIMDSVNGDRLSMTIHNLVPMSTYYFKIQARNAKGYGPLSPVATYISRHYGSGNERQQRRRIGDGDTNKPRQHDAFYTQIGQMLTTNFIYVLIGVVSVVLLFLLVILAVVCVQRRSPSGGSPAVSNVKHDYLDGRKYSGSTLTRHNNNQQPQPDLWIHQQLRQQQQDGVSRFALLNASDGVEFVEVAAPIHDAQHYAAVPHMNSAADSPPPRYQTLQERLMTQSYHSESPTTYAVLPLGRQVNKNVRLHQQHRKSLPPQFSVASETSSSQTQPFALYTAGQRSLTHSCCCASTPQYGSTMRQHRNFSGGARGLVAIPCSGSNSMCGPIGATPFTAGVGVPTTAVPVISVAKRSLTAKMKPFASVLGSKSNASAFTSAERNGRVKTVNFSPDISVTAVDSGEFKAIDNGFPWERRGADSSPQPSSSSVASRDTEGGTLTKSYHQSSGSLELTRQKTPQILYTGVNRQPIAKVEFAQSSEHGSYAGSTSMLPASPPPSSLNDTSHDGGKSASTSHQYALRTLNPLKSFAQMGGAPPPSSASPYLSGGGVHSDVGERHKTAHIVRPVVIASPTLRNSTLSKPAGVVIGQKSALFAGKLPVGRATAQPRVDVSEGIHSPYSTVRATSDFLNNNGKCNGNSFAAMKTDLRMDTYGNRHSANSEETKPLKSMLSAEDVDEIGNFDHMIDTLQQLQQGFTDG